MISSICVSIPILPYNGYIPQPKLFIERITHNSTQLVYPPETSLSVSQLLPKHHKVLYEQAYL